MSKKTVLAQISASIAVNTNNKFTATYKFFRMPLPTQPQIAILFESRQGYRHGIENQGAKTANEFDDTKLRLQYFYNKHVLTRFQRSLPVESAPRDTSEKSVAA